MKTETPRQRTGRLVREEKGLSQLKMGDAMTFENLIWDEALRDPKYMAWALRRAVMRKKKSAKMKRPRLSKNVKFEGGK